MRENGVSNRLIDACMQFEYRSMVVHGNNHKSCISSDISKMKEGVSLKGHGVRSGCPHVNILLVFPVFP
jgi:hypothetical protein